MWRWRLIMKNVIRRFWWWMERNRVRNMHIFQLLHHSFLSPNPCKASLKLVWTDCIFPSTKRLGYAPQKTEEQSRQWNTPGISRHYRRPLLKQIPGYSCGKSWTGESWLFRKVHEFLCKEVRYLFRGFIATKRPDTTVERGWSCDYGTSAGLIIYIIAYGGDLAILRYFDTVLAKKYYAEPRSTPWHSNDASSHLCVHSLGPANYENMR